MTAKRVGRNDPCPCGSGKKYKKCCLAGEEAQDPRVQQSLVSQDPLERHEAILTDMQGDLHQLSQWSREAQKAIDTSQYEEAARLARKIKEGFPKLIEGPRILGQLCMAQGHWAEAADAYAYAISIIEGERDSFDPSVLEEMQRGLTEARSKTTV